MTYPATRCFWLEPTGKMRRSLRRYVSSSDQGQKCPSPHGYHDASAPIDEVAIIEELRDGRRCIVNSYDAQDFLGDHRWPTACAGCGRAFEPDDQWQVFTKSLYRRSDTGEILTIREAPPGAIWDAWWYVDVEGYGGPDGRCLVARCPDGHDWVIDGPASNCTMKGDTVHRCWIRHGEPPNLTVDKNGVTCAAGAGSIATKGYHGFLKNGWFTAG